MTSRSTRRDATLGRNGDTTLSTSGREHQQQMPTQTPHPTQLPEAVPVEKTATAPMLPPGPHRPLTPCMPLPASPASSLSSSASLFQEDGYSSASEEESKVTFTHGRCNGTSPNQHAERTSTPTPSDYQHIKPIPQQDPTEDTTTPAAPTEVEGPPSSRLRSKTKQQHTSPKQEQPECNPTEIEVNSIDIIPKTYSWLRLTELLSYAGKTIADPAPVSLP